jgi:hypothetical protein
MPSYHFDLGNTNSGCVGMCARVHADSKSEAVRRPQNAFEHADTVAVAWDWDGQAQATIRVQLDVEAVEYFHLYLNLANMSPRHIDDVDDEDDSGLH